MCKVIAVSTNKGGVLKTSITTNLAALYAMDGNKVLIIDTDNQGNAALTFGIDSDEAEISTYDVLAEGADPLEAAVRVNDEYELDLIQSNDDMAMFEFDVLTKPNKYPDPFKLLRNAIEQVKTHYDYVFIDSPPSLGLNTGNVLAAADTVIIPYQPETYSMRSLTKIIEAIGNFRDLLNPDLSIMGIVATMVKRGTVLHSQGIQMGRSYAEKEGIKFFETVIPSTIRGSGTVAYESCPSVLSKRTNNKELNKLIAAYTELYEEVNEGMVINAK